MSELYFTPLKGKNAYLRGWQEKKLTYEEAKKYGGTGVGIVHRLSNTCCIDVDDMDLAYKFFNKNDMMLDDILAKGFRVLSPNDKSGKAIFRVPEGLRLNKFTLKDEETGIQFIEFRSGGHQDAWPGSQYHFTGKGFDEYIKGNVYSSHKDNGDDLPDLPIELVKLWIKYNGNGMTSSSSDDSVDSPSDDSAEDVEDIISTIISGKQGLHGAINKYAYMQVNDGVSKKMVVKTLEGLMMACSAEIRGSGRWIRYYDDIQRSVEGVSIGDSGDIDLSDIEVSDDVELKRIIPWPPGLMGQLCDNAYDMQRYQYKEVAMVSAIGLVAGICGRKFNISGTGLNVYMTLIMRTGMGKDSIREFIAGTLNRLNDNGNSSSFVGPGRFTGPKGIFNSLKSARCRVSVFTEAGLLLRSTAGDQDGLTRALLQLYSCSGRNQFSMEEVYSKGEDSVESMQGPCLSIINEATPETLLGAFKNSGALENGHLPRQSIYRVIGDKPLMNFSAKHDIDDSIKKKLKALVSKCASTQSSNDSAAWDMIPDEDVRLDMIRMGAEYVGIENDNRDTDTLRSIMASRCLLKAMKFASLASIMNHTDAKIKMAEWDWAKEMVKFEMDGLTNFFQGNGDNAMDYYAQSIASAILNVINDKYKDQKAQMASTDRRNGICKVTIIRYLLKKNKELKEIDDDPKFKSSPLSGIDKTLNYMVNCQYIKWTSTLKDRVQVTNSFRTLFDDGYRL